MPFFDPIRIGASGAADTTYTVDRSLRFNDDDTAYLSRDFGSGGNRKKWTFSAWIKRGNLAGSAGEMRIFGGDTNASHIFFPTNDEITWDVAAPGSSASGNLNTTQVFRDPSAWFHLVCALDTDESTADNRMRMYINGTEVTSFGSRTNPSSGYALNAINADGDRATHTLGYRTSAQGSAGMEFDGYMTEVNFVDGQQYDPSYFGETNAETGQWVPKKYSGSYGTTGFYLNFSDNSGTTATTLGKDSSGNGNNFTPNGFSVAAGKEDDSSFDSPTNNFPTLSPISKSSEPTVTNGNLRWYYNYKPASKTVRATMALPSTGKIYMEWENEQASSQAGRMSWGLVRYASQSSTYDYQAYNNVDYINISFGGSMWNGTTHVNPAWGSNPSFYSGERCALAVDCSNGKWWVGKVASNGTTTWYAADGGTDGDPAGGTNETATLPSFTTATEWIPFVGWYDGGGAVTQQFSANINFGNHSFLGTVPNGFEKLCSANLPDPTIKLPNQHFNTLLYTGNDSSDRDITGVGFQPDWLWIKNRSQGDWHHIVDAVRGANVALFSNTTDGDDTDNSNGHVNSFLADGFNVDAGASGNVNENNENYVAWNWNAGDTDGKTYTVKVVSDSGNKYRFDDFGTSAVTLDLAEGGTYIFDQSDSSNSTHPLRFYTAADKSGGEYTTGVTTSGTAGSSGATVTITIAASAPTLYYQCSSHAGMGGQINTNSTLGSSNFDGTGQSTAKVNASAGFSITSYTGNSTGEGVTQTIGHGLGVTPQLIILKSRSWSSGSAHWAVHHHKIPDANTDYLKLNNNSATTTGDTAYMNQTLPTSTVFSLGYNYTTNKSSETYIAYCFSEVAGYSKFGKYTGNGSSDGTFVYTGFRPAWVMFKSSSSGGSSSYEWMILDNKRETFNSMYKRLKPNSSDSENTNSGTTAYVDFLSNGFKIRGTGSLINQSGVTYIYLAFAESPFKNSRAR